MTRVLVGGVFNLLHPGHLHFLEAAKELGDALVVVIARKEHVAPEKQGKLFFSAEERVHLVGALKMVNRAIIGNTGDILDILDVEKPDVIALGYDQKFPGLEEKLKTRGFDNIKVVRLSESMEPERLKSSKLIERMKNGD